MDSLNQPSQTMDENISPVDGYIVEIKPSNRKIVVACIVSCLGAVLFGLAIGYSSPALADLQNDTDEGGMNLSEEQVSWFGSLVTIGGLIGGPIASLIVDKLGRKYTVMLCTFPTCVGWLLIIVATNFMLLCLGRIFTGVGVGMCCLALPTYIAEMSPANLRGMLGAGFQLSVTLGVLIIFALGVSLNYIWLAVFSSVLTVIHVASMTILPESSTHHTSNTAAGIDDREYNIEGETTRQMRLKDIFVNPVIYKPLIIILVAMVFQQFSGINAVIFYSESIFHGAGFENQGSIPSVILATVQVVMTFVSCLIVDKLGRKILLIISGSVMVITCVTFSLYYFLTDKDIMQNSDWYAKALSLGSLGIYVSGFSIGWGPIPWLYMAEILPLTARGTCSGIATSVNWISAFLVTKFFSNLQKEIHSYGTFWLFAAINLAGVLFVILVMRETKGKSLDEIEKFYSTNNEYETLHNTEDCDE